MGPITLRIAGEMKFHHLACVPLLGPPYRDRFGDLAVFGGFQVKNDPKEKVPGSVLGYLGGYY